MSRPTGSEHRPGWMPDVDLRANPTTIATDVPDRRDVAPGGRPLRILIVEDEVDIANALKGVLVADGHAVDMVEDGRLALEWAASYAYDLVILDVILPG